MITMILVTASFDHFQIRFLYKIPSPLSVIIGANNAHGHSPQPTAFSGQSYNHFTLVIYDSRAIITINLLSLTTLES